MASINELTVEVDAVTAGLQAAIERATDAIEDLGDKVESLDDKIDQVTDRSVDVDTAQSVRAIDEAENEAQSLNRALEKVDGKEINVDVDTGDEAHKVLPALREASSRFSGLSRAMGVLRKRIPKVAGAIGGAAASIALYAGGVASAAAGTALLTGALAGVTGAFGAAGIAAAALSERVQDAYKALGGRLKATLLAISEPIQNVLVELAQRLEGVFGDIAPELQAIFADVAQYVRVFADALLPVVDRVMPSFVSLVNSAKPLVQAFAQGLASLGPAIRQSLGRLQEGMPSATQFTNDFFDALGKVLVALSDLAVDLAKMGGPLLGQFLSALDEVVKVLGAVMKVFVHLGEIVSFGMSQIARAVSGTWGLLKNIFESFIDLITLDFAGAWKNAKQAVAVSLGAIGNIITHTLAQVLDSLSRLVSLIPGIGDSMAQAMQRGAKAMRQLVSDADGTSQKVTSAFRDMGDAALEMGKGIDAGTRDLMDRALAMLESSTVETVSAVQRAMQSLSDTMEGIALGGKLAKARGEFDELAQMQSKLEAVGGAWQEVAAETGENSEKARQLWQRYQAILDKIREIEEARAIGQAQLPGLGPVRVQPEETVSLSQYGLDPQAITRQMNAAVENMKSRWKKASEAIGALTANALGRAVDSASQRFGQQFSGAVMSLFRGPDEMRMASLEERKLSLKDQLTGLRESLRQGEISHAMYSAKVKSIHAELAETNKQLAYETAGFFEKTFRSIGNLVENVIQQVIAAISAAIAKALALAAIKTVFGAATGGFGAAFVGALSGMAGAVTNSVAGVSPRPIAATQSGGITVHVTGQLTGRGQDLIGTINTTQNANTRRGR